MNTHKKCCVFFLNKHIAHYVFTHSACSHKKLIFILFFLTEHKKSTKLFSPGHKILWYKDERRRQGTANEKNESYGSLWLAMFVFFVPAKLQIHEKGIFNTFKARKNTFPSKRKDFNGVWQHIHQQNIFYDHNIFLYLHP